MASRLTSLAAATAFVWSAGVARSRSVSAREERVFRTFNNGPTALHPPIWAVMQGGSLGAVIATTAALLARDDRTNAAVVGLVGTGVWAGVKAVKPAIGRGRPAHHLANVNVRGAAQTGLGFPSGHAAVSLTLALLAAPAGPVRATALAGAVATGGARMYAGAHLPLDVVGGVATAVLVVAATNALPATGRR